MNKLIGKITLEILISSDLLEAINKAKEISLNYSCDVEFIFNNDHHEIKYHDERIEHIRSKN